MAAQVGNALIHNERMFDPSTSPSATSDPLGWSLAPKGPRYNPLISHIFGLSC